MKLSDFDLKDTVTKRKITGLWRLMQSFRGIYLIAVICVGFAAVARSGLYFLLAHFVDKVLPSQEILSELPIVVGALIALSLLQGTFSFAGGRLAARTAEEIACRIRNYLYDHIQRLTFSYHDRMQTGELLQRSTSDVDAIRRMFADQAIGIGRIALLFLVNLTALLMLNVKLALFSIIVIPFIIVISLYFFVKVGQAYERYQDQEAKLSSTIQEYLTGVRVVKAFARQEFEVKGFDVLNIEKFRRGRRLTLMHSMYWPLTDIVCGLQMIAGFFLAALMVMNGTITVGMYVAYIGFVTQIIWPIRNLGRLIADASTGFVSFGRIQQIVRIDREPLTAGTVTPKDKLKGALRFEDVSFAYEGENDPVLYNITFNVEPGQKIALFGGTGSGKSSLISLLPRFYEYADGNIILDGKNLKDYTRESLRKQIGVVMQEPFLFSDTIKENITYGITDEISEDDIKAAARAASIHDVILSFPKGYDTLVGERGVTLSGGQSQRVALARTILRDPGILIMDDATSAIDTETDEAIQSALRKLMNGRTSFIISHRIQSVMDADQIIVMEQGRIIQSGTHNELLNQSGTYRRIYDLQARIEAELEADLETADIASGVISGSGELS